jgi:hypothetical protein
MINQLNPAIAHIPCSLPCQEANSGTSTTVNLKIYSKKTTCNIDTEVPLFDSSKLAVLWFNSRGLGIITM